MCKADCPFSLCLPGSEIPNWISHQTIGSLISFRAPSSYCDPDKIWKLLVWAVYATNEEPPRDFDRKDGFGWNFRNKTRSHGGSVRWARNAKFFNSFEDHMVVEAMNYPGLGPHSGVEVEGGDEIEVEVICMSRWFGKKKCGIQVKKCGIHLVKEPNVIDEDESALLHI
jgi:hypothetical protein